MMAKMQGILWIGDKVEIREIGGKEKMLSKEEAYDAFLSSDPITREN